MVFEGDIEVDDLVEEKSKKKKIDSGQKGKRHELALGKILKKRFGFEFTRTSGSGNRWGQVQFLPAHAEQTYSGDLVCPGNFRFVIECKGGYDDAFPDLYNLILRSHPKLDEWIHDANRDSDRCGRDPVIIWKKTRKPWLAIFPKSYMKKKIKSNALLYCYEEKESWMIIPLDSFFELPDEFFYRMNSS